MTNARIWNFSAGPATLPASVLEEASQSLLDFKGTGMGICELGHRSAAYDEVHTEAEARVRRLAGADADAWTVLFLTGGASSQFYQVPMNLGADADYVVTGAWAKKAFAEAKALGGGHEAASSADTTFNHIPKALDLRDEATYVHMTSNNTIYGTQYASLPAVGDVPLVSDMSSDMFCRPLDLDAHSLIYAGAQKNLGPAGVTLVLVRNDLLARSPASLPTMINYNTHAGKRSLFNTPPTFPIYVVSLVLGWIEAQGGLDAMAARNTAKANALYDAIDAIPLYEGHAAKEDRSLMNVTFRLANPELDAAFLKGAANAGLSGLKGHRSVGGMRASIYNAMEPEGVDALVGYMRAFAEANG